MPKDAGHTPGQWTIEPAARSGHVHRIAACGYPIVQVGGRNDDEQAANAQLIAAAPAMRAALEAADAWLTASADGATPATHGLLFDSALTAVRTALAALEPETTEGSDR